MSRDHRKLRVFQMADGFAMDIYHATGDFPSDERYGLRSQMRRAAISTASNIVEGSARRTTREYVHFLNIATGSACEVRYLIELSSRLGYLSRSREEGLAPRCAALVMSLIKLVSSLQPEARSPTPEARSL